MRTLATKLPDHFAVVYVIASGPEGPSKIGFTSNLQERLAGLQTGCWMKLGVYHFRLCIFQSGGAGYKTMRAALSAAARAVERKAHAALSEMDFALHGEWFDVSVDEAIQVIDKCCSLSGVRALKIEDLASVDPGSTGDQAMIAAQRSMMRSMASAMVYAQESQPMAKAC